MSLKDKLFGKGNAFNTRLLAKKDKKAAPAASKPVKAAVKGTKKALNKDKAGLPKTTKAIPMARPGLSFGSDMTPAKKKPSNFSTGAKSPGMFGAPPKEKYTSTASSTRGGGPKPFPKKNNKGLDYEEAQSKKMRVSGRYKLK